ncbi:hypothetical protein ACH4U6_21270 [Streptomyces netropsis]|uniref:hypothetical protein n=1 Tax=Streptomyces netropsis TaxID=55404 RepID=UPI0037A7FBB3
MAWIKTGTILKDAHKTRQQILSALGAGFTDLRNSINALGGLPKAIADGETSLHADHERLHEKLDQALREIEQLRSCCTALSDLVDARTTPPAEPAELRTAPPVAPPRRAEPLPRPAATRDETDAEAPDPAKLRPLLRRAAGVSSAKLVCHRDTWAFLLEQTTHEPHFRAPGPVDDEHEGRVEVTLSGRSLIAVLLSLFGTSQEEDTEKLGDLAMATELYQRIADALENTDSADRYGPQVVIVLDDRAGPAPAEGDEGRAV